MDSNVCSSGELEALAGEAEALGAVDIEALSPAQRFVAVEKLETVRRLLAAVSLSWVSRLEQFEGCPPVGITLADVLRVSPKEARRRIRDAAQLAPRTTLTGEPLAPQLPETSLAWHAGQLDGEHLRVIQKFFADLPDHVPPAEREKAERALATHAVNVRPDQLERIAHRMALHLNPDGTFSDEDRARKRGFTWGRQRADGMREGKLVADPELQAELDAWNAKYAAPGM
ncbi:DUF222 domain-containing protein, partial [Mycolicibacterium vinylchloridicum]|uniref:DUF222 domain-containing protein n=1 Tax=Mycolicibacterium vinylchloridicum TaxID=2736928 RepID=UPI0015CC1377